MDLLRRFVALAACKPVAMVIPPKHQEAGILREVWREMNRLRDYVQSLRPLPGRNVHIKHTTQGVILEANPRGGKVDAQPAELKQYCVVSDEGDYLLAKAFNGTTLADDSEKVLKPFHLRKTPFHGRTYSFTATNITAGNPGTATDGSSTIEFTYLSNRARRATIGSLSEYQVVVPAYSANDIIFVMECVDSMAPYFGGAFTDTDLPGALLDVNLDGRAWARVATL